MAQTSGWRPLTPSEHAALLFIVALVALPVSVRFLPLAFLLGALISHLSSILSDDTHPADRPPRLDLVGVAASVSLGATLARSAPSLSALSTPWLSLLVLFAEAVVSTCCSLVVVMLYVLVAPRVSSPVARLALFPALWCSGIGLAAGSSPIGLLGAWSPVEGTEVFRWLIPFLGQPGQDWTVAVLATFFAQIFQLLEVSDTEVQRPSSPDLLGEPVHEYNERTSLLNPEEEQISPLSKSVAPQTSRPTPPTVIGALATLIALAAPSILFPEYTQSYSNPVLSQETTALSVACIMPDVSTPSLSPNKTTLAAIYLAESKALNGRARIHLWPESAIHFEHEVARTQFLEHEVAAVTKNLGIWIGVSFEDSGRDDHIPGAKNMRRNGISLVGPTGVLFTYFKQNLVPCTWLDIKSFWMIY